MTTRPKIRIPTELLDAASRQMDAITGTALRKDMPAQIGNPQSQDIYANTERTLIFVYGFGAESDGVTVISASGIPKNKIRYGQPILIRPTDSGQFRFVGIDAQADDIYSAGVDEETDQTPVYINQLRWGTIQPYSGLQVFVTAAMYGDTYVRDLLSGVFDGTALDTSAAAIQAPSTNNRAIGVLLQLDVANGTLEYKQSDEFNAGISLETAFLNSLLPSLDTDRVRIGFIKLTAGTSELTPAEIWTVPSFLEDGVDTSSLSAEYANPLTTNTTLASGRETLTRGVQTEASGIVRTTLGIWWDSGDGTGGSGSSSGSGTIGGSTGATDNAVLRADGTGGLTLQNSGVIIDDSDNMSGVGNLSLDGINFTAPTEVTIVSGAITVTQGLHIINTEGGAGEDDLDTVNGLDEGEMCIISANASSGNTVLTQSGNINFIGSAGNRTYIKTTLASERVLLIGTATGVDAHLLFEPDRKSSSGLTIASGVLDLTKREYTNIVVNAESGTTDTLTDISGSVFGSGQHIFLRAATGDTITVQHGVNDIDLIGDTDTTLDERHPLHLMNLGATSWVEV